MDEEAKKAEDRELIENFCYAARESTNLLTQIETNNGEMRVIFHQQIYENKKADQEIKTDEIDALIAQNDGNIKQVKSYLKMMEGDIKNSEVEYPNEPETRLKKTVHRTFSTKFRDVLRGSQTI